MTLQCIKTGVHAYIKSYQMSVYGDAFALNETIYDYGDKPIKIVPDTLLIRVCQREYQPISDLLHIFCDDVDHWFDDRLTSMIHNSTLIALPAKWHWLGYRGEQITECVPSGAG
jgi:hypothetical protein